MWRSLLVLVLFSIFSFLFTKKSIHFPVFHFLLSPFWAFSFWYWWTEKHFRIFLVGVSVFIAWQVFFGFHAGFQSLALLVGLCASVGAVLIAIHQVFQLKTQKRRIKVAEKSRELEATRKKYESRQQSLDHLERQVASLLNLFEIARELSESIDFSTLAENLFKSIKDELVFSRIFIWIPMREKKEGEKHFRVLEINRTGVVEEVSQVPAPELLNSLISDRQMIRVDSCWYFPAFDKNDLYAVFGIQDADEKDLAKIEVLSSFLALLVKKVSLYETIRDLSIVDDLTQVFVRRHFMDRLNEEIKRSQRFKTPLSLLMLDIDHFKRYNDEFGHMVGDATLKMVAELLKVSVRRVDLVGRYGGEEFIVVMPETKQQDALDVAERIRSSIARHTFKLYHVETKVTVSQGIATYHPNFSKLPETVDSEPIADSLIKAADQCLYQAKEDGRNRVMIFKEWV